MDFYYEYVGSTYCSGTLDNGKEWRGLRACFASLRNDIPFVVKVYKVAPDLVDEVSDLEPGEHVRLLFDEKGRVSRVLS